MGAVGHIVSSLFKGTLGTVGSLLGQSDTPTVNIPQVQTPAAAAAETPNAAPTQETAANDLSRKKRGKAALTIPTTGAGTGGTGLNL